MSARPIGVFDSGMGGLTVAKEIKKMMPSESIVYFGDTMHVPYGDKSKETVVLYAKRITEFLLNQDCKVIVIACNTVSANAQKEIREMMPKDIPLFDVITPVTEKVAFELHQSIGVIATKATINASIYKKKIRKLNKHIDVIEMATPLFVPIIEEGFFNSDVSKAAIDSYLSNKKFSKIDSLILGCTHYPLLSNEIKKYFEGRVNIINSPVIVANVIKQKLDGFGMLNTTNIAAKYIFYVSDLTKSFQKQAKRFFGKDVILLSKRLK